jgi:hypothetical protein
MPSQQSEPDQSADLMALDMSAEPAIWADEDELPEVDLISLDEPEPMVDLGDFASVWEFLATQPSTYSSAASTTPTIADHVPASRKQPRKKTGAVNKSATVDVSTKRNTTTHAPSTPTTPTQNHRVQSERPVASQTPDAKGMSTFAYNSPDDDGDDDCSLCSSSYEDKRYPFAKPRPKSFLYVPPTFSSPSIPLKSIPVVIATTTAEDRRRDLIQKLISNYPDEIHRIIPPQPPSPTSPYLSSLASTATTATTDLHIFIDNSNILIGFYDTYKSTHKVTDPFFRAPKFDFHAFSTIIERGRLVSRKILVGSNPLTQPVALAQHLGYEVSILERVVDTSKRVAQNPYASDSATRTPREKKKEQAVDEILHLKILESLLDAEKPGTIVLATCDAAPAEFSLEGGFLKCIQRALKRGWNVELVCWRKSMSRLWRDKVFRIQWRDTFCVVELDDYVDQLVLE